MLELNLSQRRNGAFAPPLVDRRSAAQLDRRRRFWPRSVMADDFVDGHSDIKYERTNDACQDVFVSTLPCAGDSLQVMGKGGTLADRFTLARLQSGLNKSELARRINRDPSAVNHIENGRTKSLKGDTLTRVAAALGVSPFWLGTGTGSMESNPHLSSDELEVIAIYRDLPAVAQQQWIVIGRTLMPPQAPPSNVLPIKKRRK